MNTTVIMIMLVLVWMISVIVAGPDTPEWLFRQAGQAVVREGSGLCKA